MQGNLAWSYRCHFRLWNLHKGTVERTQKYFYPVYSFSDLESDKTLWQGKFVVLFKEVHRIPWQSARHLKNVELSANRRKTSRYVSPILYDIITRILNQLDRCKNLFLNLTTNDREIINLTLTCSQRILWCRGLQGHP